MPELPPELVSDPAHASFFSTAQRLAGEGRVLEALFVLVRALDVNPALDRGRLLLARLFFELGAPHFAAREVRELMARAPQLKSLARLQEALEPGVTVQMDGATRRFAETQFKASELEAIEKSRGAP